jgi:hypothetical protein
MRTAIAARGGWDRRMPGPEAMTRPQDREGAGCYLGWLPVAAVFFGPLRCTQQYREGRGSRVGGGGGGGGGGTLLIDSDTQLQTCVLSTSRERPQHPAEPDCDAIIAPHADEHTHLCRCALTLAASGVQRAVCAQHAGRLARFSRAHRALTSCRCASCESARRTRVWCCQMYGRAAHVRRGT